MCVRGYTSTQEQVLTYYVESLQVFMLSMRLVGITCNTYVISMRAGMWGRHMTETDWYLVYLIINISVLISTLVSTYYTCHPFWSWKISDGLLLNPVRYLCLKKTHGKKHILLGLIQYSVFDRIFGFIRQGSIISSPYFFVYFFLLL
jgi:hypothetical protein